MCDFRPSEEPQRSNLRLDVNSDVSKLHQKQPFEDDDLIDFDDYSTPTTPQMVRTPSWSTLDSVSMNEKGDDWETGHSLDRAEIPFQIGALKHEQEGTSISYSFCSEARKALQSVQNAFSLSDEFSVKQPVQQPVQQPVVHILPWHKNTPKRHAKLPSAERTSSSFIAAAAKPRFSYFYYPENRPCRTADEEQIAIQQEYKRHVDECVDWNKEVHGIEWAELEEEERATWLRSRPAQWSRGGGGRGCT